MTVQLTSRPATPRTVECRIDTEYARDRLAKALYEVILYSVGYGPRDLPAAEDREWIRGAIAIPIRETTEVTLHILASHLGKALEQAPSGLSHRFEAGQEAPEPAWD
jgi:hypothetical protein